MRLAIVLLLSAVLFGCTTYYQVRDPGSGNTYYTTKVETQKGGAVSLKDHRTNAQVTIQSSEVIVITGEQHDAAIRNVAAPPPPTLDEPPAESPSGQ